jgi:hypothetical protein
MTLQLEAVAAEAPQVVPGPALAPAATPTKVVPDVRYKVARYVAAATVLACGALGVGTLLAPAKKPLPPAAASPSPVDTDADVPVSVTRTGEDYLQILVDFKPGQGVFHAGSGEWKLDRGALVGRVFGAPRSGSSRPFAVLETPVLLAEGLNLDTTVTVDPTPPVGYTPVESPSMEVLLRGEGGGKLGLTAVFGPKGGFALALRPPEGETVEERRTLAEGDRLAILPVAGKPLHLRLSAVGKGEIEIFAGAEEPLPLVFKKKLSVRDLSGKVALSCGEATCRFTRLEVVGRLARLPKPPAAVDPVP